MDENELNSIESRLGVKLPKSYRVVLSGQADRLKELGWFNDANSSLYLAAEYVVGPNLEERRPESDVASIFPEWWKSFVLIGTTGGGDYYALRLNNRRGVWLIGSDCGDTPTKVAGTLLEHVESEIARCRAARALEAERARKNARFQREIDAHLAAIAGNGNLPHAAKWMTTDAIYPMFQWLSELKEKVSPRKLRLYGLALCDLIPDLLDDPDCAAGIALAKSMTRGKVAKSRISKMRDELRDKIKIFSFMSRFSDSKESGGLLWRANAVYFLFQDDEGYLSNAGVYPDEPDLRQVYSAVGYVVAGYPYGVECASDLLREVLGNPFHPAPILPQWRTPDVVTLAQSILQREKFDRMPELGTALEKAGCTDERIISHCQRLTDHVPGCWVVDACLGKM